MADHWIRVYPAAPSEVAGSIPQLARVLAVVVARAAHDHGTVPSTGARKNDAVAWGLDPMAADHSKSHPSALLSILMELAPKSFAGHLPYVIVLGGKVAALASRAAERDYLDVAAA